MTWKWILTREQDFFPECINIWKIDTAQWCYPSYLSEIFCYRYPWTTCFWKAYDFIWQEITFSTKTILSVKDVDDRGVYESFCGTPFLNKNIKQIWGESALRPLKINFMTCSLLLWFVKYTPYLCDRHQQSWLFSLLMFCFRKQEISYKKVPCNITMRNSHDEQKFSLGYVVDFFVFLATCAKI